MEEEEFNLDKYLMFCNRMVDKVRKEELEADGVFGFMAVYPKCHIDQLKARLIEDFFELFGHQTGGTMGEIENLINKRFGLDD